MAKAMAIESSVKEGVPIEDYLKRLDFLVRGKALAAALKAGSKVVQKDASVRISRSDKTGTAKKKSKSQRERDRMRNPLAESIAIKMVSRNDGTLHIAITGQKLEPHMRGRDRKNTTAHGHLLEFGHKAHYWSREPATRNTFVQAKRWLAPAVDSTRTQQQQAIVTSLERAIGSQR